MNEETIEQTCEAAGLDVAEIDRRDEVLVIVPASLDDLPTADELQELVGRLREQSELRYVTLAIDRAG